MFCYVTRSSLFVVTSVNAQQTKYKVLIPFVVTYFINQIGTRPLMARCVLMKPGVNLGESQAQQAR